MSASIIIGKEGTIEIPKSIREKVHLKEGDRIEMETEKRCIRIKKASDIKKIRGVWKDKDEIVEAINGLKAYWNAWKYGGDTPLHRKIIEDCWICNI
jgi:AbrB family looped-hinge helix DNA binding protein